MKEISIAFWVGAGGFIGAVSRYGLNRLAGVYFEGAFPIATFIANVAGCFLLGFISGVSLRWLDMHDEVRLFLTVGLCGGFTTFSTFMHENFLLLRNGEVFQFALYAAVSYALGFLSLWAGTICARIIFQ
ncbi:MAG: fluoride efflux transporter CrcB [Candidatus Kapaibacterium sp.]